jgi:hypothetical protein
MSLSHAPGAQWVSVFQHHTAEWSSKPNEQELNAYGQEGWQLTSLVVEPTVDSFGREKWYGVFTKHTWEHRPGGSGIQV